jgi:glycine cleavage system H protein
MIALLVVLTFLSGILLDLYMTRRHPILVVDETAPTAGPRIVPSVVGGFAVPDNVAYHPGHTWALAESPDLVRVGIDDFAAKVAGTVTHIDIPARGQWIRQGQKLIALKADGKEIDLVSPIEGTVVGINDAALRNPEVLRSDPYGNGWLLTVNSPDASTNFRNLLRGATARRWMDEAAAALRRLTPSVATAAYAQDGGVALDGAIGTLPADQFAKLEKEFFLL